MSCNLGTAKMPIVLDHPESGSNSGSQGNFNLMDLVNKSGLDDRARQENFERISSGERYDNSQIETVEETVPVQEIDDANGKKDSSYRYLTEEFHPTENINEYMLDPISTLNFHFNNKKQDGKEDSSELKLIKKKFKKKLKTKSDFPSVDTNPREVQINLVKNDNVNQQILVMKNVKPVTNKTKKSVKSKEKGILMRKNYKPIAPYPQVPDEQRLMVIQNPVQRLVNCNVNTNPILIVKIEDEQLRINSDDSNKSNKLNEYCTNYQNYKKPNEKYIDNTLLDFDNFNKCRRIELKNNKEKDEKKLKCYKCYICPFMTLSKDCLNYHLEKKGKCFTSNKVYHCPGCKNVFYSLTPLRVHLVHDHRLIQKEVKKILENVNGIDFENFDNDRDKNCWGNFGTSQQIPNGNVFDAVGMEIHGEKDMEPCLVDNKRQTMLESYLDDISSKGDCNLPPPLTENGSDLLENTFNFTAPVNEELSSIRQPPPRPPPNVLEQPHMMENPANHSYIGMANVFPDERNQQQFKENDNDHFPTTNDEHHMMGNYLSSQVNDIPVINLDGNNLDKSSGNILPHEINMEDFSTYHDEGPGPIDDDDDDRPSPVEDQDQEEKKKFKRLGVGYRCDINNCKVRLQSEKNIQYHRRCHEGTLYNCPECCKDCSTWVSLSSHLWQAHKIDMELYKCDQCPYKTPSYSRLTNIHRGIHGKARPFLCDICGKGFKTVKQMRNHKNIHKAKMVRMSVCHCEICGRTVGDKRQLELHINNTHKKKKPYLCYMCGYASAVKHSLIVHMRRHTGEKPYKCEKCEYKTADHNALRRHKMKHSGDRNYKCNHCSYSCIQASTFKVHIKTKHPGFATDVIFSCGQCNFQTLNRGSFLSHTSEHENYNGEIRKQTRNQQVKTTTSTATTGPGHDFYAESNRMDLVGPIISERVVETIVDLSGAQSLLEDDYYEVERITGDLEEAQELKFKTPVIT